jgi:hypothetical protein
VPNYDVRCPNCGDYERFKRIADRHDPCDRCSAIVEPVMRSSVPHHPFKPYFDLSLGAEVTSNHQRNQVARRLHADMRDSLSKGDLSARRDKIEQHRRDRTT